MKLAKRVAATALALLMLGSSLPLAALAAPDGTPHVLKAGKTYVLATKNMGGKAGFSLELDPESSGSYDSLWEGYGTSELIKDNTATYISLSENSTTTVTVHDKDLTVYIPDGYENNVSITEASESSPSICNRTLAPGESCIFTALPGKSIQGHVMAELGEGGTYHEARYQASGEANGVHMGMRNQRIALSGNQEAVITAGEKEITLNWSASDGESFTVAESDEPALASYTLKVGETYHILNESPDQTYNVAFTQEEQLAIRGSFDYGANGDWETGGSCDYTTYDAAGNATVTQEGVALWINNVFPLKAGQKMTVKPLDKDLILFFAYRFLDGLTLTDASGKVLSEKRNGTVPQEPSEYIYDIVDPGKNLELPTEQLELVTDTASAANAVDVLTSSMTPEQKTSPTGIDLATLYAETAVFKAASKEVTGTEILINKAAVADLEAEAAQTSAAVESSLVSGGVSTARLIFNTVSLTTEETGKLTIKIDPDILEAEVDRIRVEAPTYAITLKVADLKEDLADGIMTITTQDVGSGFAPGAGGNVPAINVIFPNGKSHSSATVAVKDNKGNIPFKTLVKDDGTPVASKHNPATNTTDGKINTSGRYTVQNNQKDFTDIAGKSAEMQEAIRYLASIGVIKGTSVTEFSPNSPISRAEVAALLVRALLKLDESAANSFTDVKSSDWYYAAAGSSQKAGLINGFPDKTFQGTVTIPKDQILAVAARVLKSEGGYRDPGDTAAYLGKYSDTVAKWAQPEIALATMANLVVPRKDGTFQGERSMTRGDAAIIISRLFQKIW